MQELSCPLFAFFKKRFKCKLRLYVGLKEWQTDNKKERLLDVCLTMQDDMKAILDYFRIDYDKTELTSRELINKHI